MEYCPHCMNKASGKFCTLCGSSLEYSAEALQLDAGSTLNSETSGNVYCIGAAKGQGGFGITYIGINISDETRVAVKEYFPVRCAQREEDGTVVPKQGSEAFYESGLKNFLKEAETLAGLEPSASVVRIYEYFQANGTAYLVMEYLDGETLSSIVQKTGKISADELFPVLPRFMEDISMFHSKGVIHRDISPDNIMRMKDGTLKLFDFGCARFMEDGKSMTVLLKHGFSPVEQYQTRGQGMFTDVYGLAATIYYCITGETPESAVERLEEDELVPPTALGAVITPEEENAILWGMAVQPKSRPVTMRKFLRALFPGSIPEPKINKNKEEHKENLTTKQENEKAKPEELKQTRQKDYTNAVIIIGTVIIIILLIILVLVIV